MNFKPINSVTPSYVRRTEIIRKLRKSIPFYVLILVPLALLITFRYVPMAGIQIAFRKYRASTGIWNSPWVGMTYVNMFVTSPSFWTIIGNTLAISLYSLIAGFPIPIILAICLNEARSARFRKTVQMVTYMPYFISTVVMVSMIMQFTTLQNGVLNNLLRAMGFRAIDFMGRSDMLRSIYVWSGIWQTAGYSAVVYLAALSGVNPELYDAALVDGASKLRRIWHIDLPSIAPTVITLFLLSTGSILSVGFEKIFLMQNGINLNVSEVISTYVYKMGVVAQNYSLSTAVSLFNSIVNFVVLILFNMISKRLTEVALW